MPTYDYECSSCGNRFEKFQPITASSVKRCPHCGKKVRRLLGGGVGVIFRGSGFYTTDYRSESYKKAAKADKDGQSDKTGNKEAGEEGQSDGKKKDQLL